MVTLEVRKAVPGLILARAVHTRDGSLLLEVGTVLDGHTIDLLDLWGVSHIAVESLTPSVVPAATTPRPATRAAKSASAALQDDPRFSLPKRTAQKVKVQEVGRWIREETRKTLTSLTGVRSDIDAPRLKQMASSVVEESTKAQEMMLSLTTVLDYDTYLFAHCVHVSILGVVMGIAMGLSQREIHVLASSGLLLDIGMMKVDRAIWEKTKPLTQDEFAQIKKHPVLAIPEAERLLGGDQDALQVIVQHHERMDGSGYPRKMGGLAIHPLARVIAVCDIYEAMQAPRAYRKTWLPHQVMNHLLVSSTETLDAEVVKVFLRTMAAYPIGSFVRLDTGALGVVVSANRQSPIRPVVKVFRDGRGQALTKPIFLDLALEKHFITGPVDPRDVGVTPFEAF